MPLSQTILSASTLEGDNVKNAEGENLGDIKDIMIDTTTGQVEYYVVSFGGFLGIGDKYFAVPPQAISADTEHHCMILNIDKERLKDAPGFDKDDWPDMADPSFRDQVYTHYGFEAR